MYLHICTHTPLYLMHYSHFRRLYQLSTARVGAAVSTVSLTRKSIESVSNKCWRIWKAPRRDRLTRGPIRTDHRKLPSTVEVTGCARCCCIRKVSSPVIAGCWALFFSDHWTLSVFTGHCIDTVQPHNVETGWTGVKTKSPNDRFQIFYEHIFC